MCDSPGSHAARLPSPYALAEQLVEVTAEGGDVDHLILSWPPRTLIEVDAATRSDRFHFEPPGRSTDALLRRRHRSDDVAVLSMTHDGHRREAAVRQLATRPGVAADRLLALRLGDHVPQVREAAWQALLQRPLTPQVGVVVPVLVALRGRLVAAHALDDYASVVEGRRGRPAWQDFLDDPDRMTRRWAVTERINHGLDPATAMDLLARERDLVLMRALAEVAVADPGVARQLLTGRTAVGRRRALEALPEAELSAALFATLVDRSAMVRAMAAFRASTSGIDVTRWYRDRWSEFRDPWALAGLLETGGVLPRSEARALLTSPSTRLRRLGVRMLARLGVERDDLPLLWSMLEGAASSQVVRTLSRSYCWGWADIAWRWEEADSRMRRRLWRLLSSRTGWDEVRAHLLAACDPRISGLGRAGLGAWAVDRASRMYRSPSPEQRDHLLGLLENADIPVWQRDRIRFLVASG